MTPTPASSPHGATLNTAAVLVALMPMMPAWGKLKAAAHTLPYDLAIMDGGQQGQPLPPGRWDSLTSPTLVIAGGKSPAWLRNAQQALTDTLPGASRRILDGQTHIVKPKPLAPVLADFFTHSQGNRTTSASDI